MTASCSGHMCIKVIFTSPSGPSSSGPQAANEASESANISAITMVISLFIFHSLFVDDLDFGILAEKIPYVVCRHLGSPDGDALERDA